MVPIRNIFSYTTLMSIQKCNFYHTLQVCRQSLFVFFFNCVSAVIVHTPQLISPPPHLSDLPYPPLLSPPFRRH